MPRSSVDRPFNGISSQYLRYRLSSMAIQFTLALVVSSLCLMPALESFVQTKRIADSAQVDRPAADVQFAARAKRHAPPSRAFLIAPPSARKMEADGAVPRSGRSAAESSLQGLEHENQEGPGPANTNQPTSDAAPTTAAPEGSDQAISPLVVYAIVAGLVLTIVAMLVVAIAVVYIVCTIPACDKDDEEDPCAAPKGKASGSARRRPSSAPLSRCPSFSRHSAGDRRYTQPSVDLGRQSSRGSSLGRQSSCRICPRFAPKSSRARASCASTGTCGSGASDGPVAPGAAPAPSANDYIVSCVCDLPTPRDYSPSVSAASTFGRC